MTDRKMNKPAGCRDTITSVCLRVGRAKLHGEERSLAFAVLVFFVPSCPNHYTASVFFEHYNWHRYSNLFSLTSYSQHYFSAQKLCSDSMFPLSRTLHKKGRAQPSCMPHKGHHLTCKLGARRCSGCSNPQPRNTLNLISFF